MKHRRKKLTALLIAVSLWMLAFPGCATLEDQMREYSIGDKGPAGGIIFYDRGPQEGRWRYLEAAPAEYEQSLRWGPSDIEAETSMALGAGPGNTQAVVEAFDAAGEFDTAAQYSSSVVINGYDDWFLPSREELNLMYRILGVSKPEDFRGVGYGYWSSSQYSRTLAWAQGFASGVQGRIEQFDRLIVRPIRAF